jgi:hypothetical protein
MVIKSRKGLYLLMFRRLSHIIVGATDRVVFDRQSQFYLQSRKLETKGSPARSVARFRPRWAD